ncbi:hypothetical protein V8G54_016261 [Vigna mungo]|uniref:Reverse transcriptase n=1 Tax=Vigna mungo TaxID=3915 RepID=A0AAQ3S0Y8_VIGMU
MEFTAQRRRHVLHDNSSTNIKTIRKLHIPKTMATRVHLSKLQICKDEEGLLLHSLSTHATSATIPNSIDQLLLQYEDVFVVPTTSPPRRLDHDHTIPLMQGTNLVNKRPYHNSPYSSPMVLVVKKDGSWRLCIDYKDLNKSTVKNMFPIPLVDDKLDELYGSSVFSKIDLQSDYNQSRNAFKTYVRHYEYLVMPFRLTNALATFQGLMNSMFREYLTKFLMVLFYDILIYNKCMENHLHHLHTMLSTMRTNALVAKKSKCYFEVTRVEYLGHFITGEGVFNDPAKVEAVRNWPLPQTLKQLRGFWDQLSQVRVLALLDFTRTFVVEVDASVVGELLVVVYAVQKWRHYLLPTQFVIKTDHRSLKYILDQRLSTAFQQKWLNDDALQRLIAELTKYPSSYKDFSCQWRIKEERKADHW